MIITTPSRIWVGQATVSCHEGHLGLQLPEEKTVLAQVGAVLHILTRLYLYCSLM